MASQQSGPRVPSGNPTIQALQQRLHIVVQHQQFFWWVGHVIIVLSTLIHAILWFRFSYDTKMAVFWYRLALLGAIGAYGVVVHKMYFRVCLRIGFFGLTSGWLERSTKARRPYI